MKSKPETKSPTGRIGTPRPPNIQTIPLNSEEFEKIRMAFLRRTLGDGKSGSK